jgi:AcrR family transcriptional regulator
VYAEGMGTIREKKKASTVEALLESAKSLFDERGYEKTTVDEIAERAVISKFTFYSYFQSKEELLDELHHRGLTKALSLAEDLLQQGASVSEILLHQTSAMAEWYEQNRELAIVLLNQRRLPLLFKTESNSCFLSLVSLIKRGQDAGELSTSTTAEDIAKYAYLFTFGEKMSWVQADCAYPLKPKMVAATQFLLKALKP